MTQDSRFFRQISALVAQAIADLDGLDLAEVSQPAASGAPLFATVQSHFERQGWQHQRLPGKTALRFTYQGQQGKWVCIVSTREQARQVVIYSLYPPLVPEARRLAIAEFLTRANYHLTLGNFDLDFESGQVRLRTGLLLTPDTFRPALLQQLLLHHLQTADRHLGPYLAVLAGERSPQEAMTQLHP